MSGPWNDFNSAQSNTNVIPKGTLAKVRLTLRPGGFDDASQGWTGGWARRAATGAVYLDAEYTVLEGPYARRKIWSLIGLYSPKGPDLANMGRGMIRGILNSARGVSDKDASPEAQLRRRINGFGDLDGLEFIARIDVGQDTNGDDKNEIRAAVTPDHREYAGLMGAVAPQSPAASLHSLAPQQPAASPQTSQPVSEPGNAGRPSWAQGGVRGTLLDAIMTLR